MLALAGFASREAFEGEFVLVIQLLQLFVLVLLAFCMFFGLGFIINMLMKTTWFPIAGYVVFVIAIIYTSWGPQSFLENIAGYSVSDYLPLLSGLGGAVASGFVIKTLRAKGYKMF